MCFDIVSAMYVVYQYVVYLLCDSGLRIVIDIFECQVVCGGVSLCIVYSDVVCGVCSGVFVCCFVLRASVFV